VVGEVKIPKSLCPLEKLEVVLHLALDKCGDRNRLVNLVLGKGV
jgi:hypothetical protein